MTALDLTPSAAAIPGVGIAAADPMQQRGRPFGFWATLALGLAVVVLAPVVAGVACLGLSRAPSESEAPSLVFLIFADIAAAGLITAVVALGARRRGWTITSYLGLNWPCPRDVALGVGGYVGFGLAWYGLTLFPALRETFADADQDWVKLYREAAAGGFLPLLWLAVVVAAPVAEEFLFRGFLFRGWSESRLGVIGAIVLVSILWSLLHVGYSSVVIGVIFVMGVALSWLRWRTGSTTLTIMLHVLHNLLTMIIYAGAANGWWSLG